MCAVGGKRHLAVVPDEGRDGGDGREARELILSQTRLAARALSTASWVMPFSPAVREARDKIERFEKRVYAANTQADVARDFSEFLGVPAEPASATTAWMATHT